MFNKIDCSIIIPVYFNERSIPILFEKLKTEVLPKINKTVEIIFIDDGSGDKSYDEMCNLYQNNRGLIKLIKLSRNFGQVAAIYAGYHLASGDCIITMSADLQDPPSLILDMVNGYYRDNYEIVICHRESRDETWSTRKASALFYSLAKKIVVPNMPKGGFDFFLISNRVKNTLLSNSEKNIFIQAQIILTGFKYKLIPYHRSNRVGGKSRWTLSKKIKYVVDSILSYSYLPIRLMSVFGGIISLTGFIYAIIIVIAKILNDTPFRGWAPIMILILVLSGIQMLMLGIIGEYLWRTLDQVRNRPQFIIENVLD